MRKRKVSAMLISGGLAVLLAGCAGTGKGVEQAIKEGGSQLKTAQLTDLLKGNTIHVDQYGEQADIELNTDGSFRAVNYLQEKDKGRWTTSDNRLCLHFGTWDHGENRCYTIYRVGEEYRELSSNGTLIGTFSVTEGTTSQPGGGKPVHPKTAEKPDQEAPAAKTEAAPAQAEAETAASPPAAVPAAQDVHARDDLRVIDREMAKNCPGCPMVRVELSGADLIEANLAGADLTSAGLGKANLRRANLRGAKLVAADLAGADLGGADLQGADLSRADLTGANFFKANLRGAILDGSVGANLEGAIR
ncbi:MAG: pentapeptide repeat-containing protein [Desulfobacteraceae bacterium]|nr:pentapeptide repeat-containing protein [Desulfobacteraceae bacterium]